MLAARGYVATCASLLTLAGVAAPCDAGVTTFLATSGRHLFRVTDAGGGVEHFDLGDSIISLNVMNDGRVLAYSNTRNQNNRNEVYELLNPVAGVPFLSILAERDGGAATQTQVGDTLYGVQGGILYTLDATDYHLSPVGSISGLPAGDGTQTGGSAYDRSTRTFYLTCRDAMLYTVDLATPSATAIGGLGISSFNQGLEFNQGRLFGAFGDGTAGVVTIGSLNTATGAFESAIATIDLSPYGGIAAVGFAAIPTPGATAMAALAGLACLRRPRR